MITPLAHPHFASLQTRLETEYANPANVYYFPSHVAQGLLKVREEEYAQAILDGSIEPKFVANALFRFARYYLNYMHYAVLGVKDDDLAWSTMACYTRYADAALQVLSEQYLSTDDRAIVHQNHLNVHLASMLILGQWDAVADNTQRIVQGICATTAPFIASDNRLLCPVMWFLLNIQSAL